MALFDLARPLLHALSAETAHDIALRALKLGVIGPLRAPNADPMLSQPLFGLNFPNPVGLAAGFDKNAAVVDACLRQGFGFVEAGTVTPKPQSGNPRPRIFRLRRDRAVINRLGFNNLGVDVFVSNLKSRKRSGIVGANIGRNKDSEDAIADYVLLLEQVSAHCDYVTINISSPNTQGLRALQQKRAFEPLIIALTKKREALVSAGVKKVPLLVKIAPDLEAHEIADVVEVALGAGLDGIIVSNTTIKRPTNLQSDARVEQGGLSGGPLFEISTAVLRECARLAQGKIPLVGVGGITSAQDAYAKIRAGASLVQVYTALTYQGFDLVTQINATLPQLLRRDGFTHLRDAVGADLVA